MKLLISFKGKSGDYSHGVEFGRIYAKMEKGDAQVDNSGFPVHLANKKIIKSLCNCFGYTAIYGATYFDEWIDFRAIKNDNLN